MKHKTWFRLVIKAIGVLLVGMSVPAMTTCIIQLVILALEFAGNLGLTNQFMVFNWPYYVGGVIQCFVGVYLFFGGAWIVNKAIPSNRPYCPECGYDISSSTSARCPECGIVLPELAPRRARRWLLHV